MTVYTVHELRPEHEANMADWGTVVPVNYRFIFPDELGKDGSLPPAFINSMERCARNFRPGVDYVVLSGDQLQIAAFCSILSHRHGWYNVLKYERREKAYFPAMIRSYDLVRPAQGVVVSEPQTGVIDGEVSSEGRGSVNPLFEAYGDEPWESIPNKFRG